MLLSEKLTRQKKAKIFQNHGVGVHLPCDEYSGVLATDEEVATAATVLASFDCLKSLLDPAAAAEGAPAGIPLRMTVPQELDEVDGG